MSLASALVGLASAGGIIWFVRIIGRYALGKEAMGFGDVTLMAMIGSFLGWQACLFVFFVAPFAGLILGAAQWLAHREHELPYGPFLCLAALLVIVNWAPLWEWASKFFSIPWLGARRDGSVHGADGCAVERTKVAARQLSAKCGIGMNESPKDARNRNRHGDIDKLNLEGHCLYSAFRILAFRISPCLSSNRSLNLTCKPISFAAALTA